ncbi:PQ loop repeat protein-like protein [Sporormia fimetaria CBS 119925]|uniref:PQ loop repeat protein-like protein n=1 Tax=Sporormia fimetaria CBS 119925 TaxID=1340428 RepID=A0A6A6VLS4_9PLEO|nr:PQ loop repeat protein-like protein [Sporormia fimetaria CBS 119925]
MNMLSPHLSERCRELAHPDVFQFSVSVFIVVGILVSYLPQHYKIISRRSSAGLSPMFVLLGTVSGTASIANILTLPESTRDMACCKDIGRFPCTAALLGVTQIGVQWTCFFFIMLLFLIFFPRNAPDNMEEDNSDIPTWKEAILVLAFSLFFFIFALLGSIVFAYPLHDHIRKWANFLGVLASLLAAIQYLPQIYTTWCLQQIGSLSVPMMCIQTPGSFVFASSLAARLGPAGWSTWGLFILTGCLQGCLLTMCLWFMWRDRAQKKTADTNSNPTLAPNRGAQNGGVHEQTPLLSNGSASQES